MDPNVTLTLGLSALAESRASLPEELDIPKVRDSLRNDAREFASDLFEWLCRGGFYPADRAGCDKLLSEFGYDSNPTLGPWSGQKSPISAHQYNHNW
jgi:hypothetical protein